VSFLSLLNRTATITHRGDQTVGADGRPQPGATTTTTSRCRLEQTAASEVTVGQSTYVTNWRIYFPAGVPLDGGDALTIDGRHFELVGQPWEVDGASTVHHIEARATEVVG
jgi:hypothetical protein